MKTLLLVGAGHVHVALLARSAQLRAAGFDVHLIDPGSFWYGGARAALLGGRLERSALRLPLAAACREQHVRYHADRAIGLDARHRRVWLASGQMQVFDTVSHDVGYESGLDIDGDSHHGPALWQAADVSAMLQFVRVLEQARQRSTPLRIAVVGDGARAAETVAALAGGPFAAGLQISWVLPGARVSPNAPRGHDRFILRHLARCGVEIVPQTPISRQTNGAICSPDGRRFPVDHAVFAGPGEAAHFVHAGRMPASAEGLHVNRRLQSPRDERIYAVGGCAAVLGRRANHQFSVEQQARVLAHNIEAGARRRPFKSCRGRPGGPIITLGNGQAIAWRGRWWWQGAALARRLARRDERWLAWIAGYSQRG
jgi:NADH dehydrogenase FAD-containing subunit